MSVFMLISIAEICSHRAYFEKCSDVRLWALRYTNGRHASLRLWIVSWMALSQTFQIATRGVVMGATVVHALVRCFRLQNISPMLYNTMQDITASRRLGLRPIFLSARREDRQPFGPLVTYV